MRELTLFDLLRVLRGPLICVRERARNIRDKELQGPVVKNIKDQN